MLSKHKAIPIVTLFIDNTRIWTLQIKMENGIAADQSDRRRVASSFSWRDDSVKFTDK